MAGPSILILAAGIGSRFGGPKQIAAVDCYGHAIIDYSLFDAYRAGFRKVIFVIKKEIEKDFKERIGCRTERHFDVRYVFQDISMLPEGFTVPEGRVRPWGTAHAVYTARKEIEEPFAVLNADDFYGRGAFEALYGFLSSTQSDNEHAMVAYKLRKTLTEHGHVARGICAVENGILTDIVERTFVVKDGNDAAYKDDSGQFHHLPGDSRVSMNCWGFGKGFINELVCRFPAWLREQMPKNPEKGEYFLPFVVNSMIADGKGSVRVLECSDVWYGMTYREDMPAITKAIAAMQEAGLYSSKLLD